jgi:hypothetical protein
LREPGSVGRVSDHRLLLTGLLTRRFVLLTGLALVRHGVSFHGNIRTTDHCPRRSDKSKMAVCIAATM